MRYYDYEWDLESNRILLDAELDIDALGWHHGDLFKVTNVNGRAMLIKVDPLVKFIEEGLRNGQMETGQPA
jgi:anaerobic selenocysteine-containing dehydrogenase